MRSLAEQLGVDDVLRVVRLPARERVQGGRVRGVALQLADLERFPDGAGLPSVRRLGRVAHVGAAGAQLGRDEPLRDRERGERAWSERPVVVTVRADAIGHGSRPVDLAVERVRERGRTGREHVQLRVVRGAERGTLERGDRLQVPSETELGDAHLQPGDRRDRDRSVRRRERAEEVVRVREPAHFAEGDHAREVRPVLPEGLQPPAAQRLRLGRGVVEIQRGRCVASRVLTEQPGHRQQDRRRAE